MSRRVPWEPPEGAESVERVRTGPFVTREVVRRQDGSLLVYTGRRIRKGLGPAEVGATPTHQRVLWAPHRIAWWISILFMVGSFFFALGSFPGISSVLDPGVIGVIFFVGSIFFTSAGYCAFVESCNAGRAPEGRARLFAWQPARIDWWACGIQSIGTLWFNVNTFEAMQDGLDTRAELFRIWTPDFLGSICFLVASWLAVMEVCQGGSYWRPHDVTWRIVAINMLGSVFFMISAGAAFVLPDTGDVIDAALANAGTFLGAVCFFWAARLLLDEMATSS